MAIENGANGVFPEVRLEKEVKDDDTAARIQSLVLRPAGLIVNHPD